MKNGNGHLKIEKGIPVPKILGAGHPKCELTLLLQEMKKGDSVYAEKTRGAMMQAASRYLGKGKYALRQEGNGFRIWRIK